MLWIYNEILITAIYVHNVDIGTWMDLMNVF